LQLSVGVAKKAARDWTNSNHKNTESLTGLNQAKELTQGLSARRIKKLLSLNRNQLWWIV
jgi:hypothetical protein